MLSRSAGSSASLRVAATVASPLSSIPRCIAVWISSSVGTAHPVACGVDQCIGVAGFFEQNVERRNVVVPFDQGWHWTEPPQRRLVERPHLADDARSVVVDPQTTAIGQLA